MALELANGVIKIADPRYQAHIPKELPVYIVTGEEDTSNNRGRGAKLLYDTYKKAGIKDIEFKSYPGARHEVYRETNKQEVLCDIIQWLDAHM